VGREGAQGRQGEDGAAGFSCKFTEVDKQTLKVTCEDGTEYYLKRDVSSRPKKK
jgi:hypothetical protein